MPERAFRADIEPGRQPTHTEVPLEQFNAPPSGRMEAANDTLRGSQFDDEPTLVDVPRVIIDESLAIKADKTEADRLRDEITVMRPRPAEGIQVGIDLKGHAEREAAKKEDAQYQNYLGEFERFSAAGIWQAQTALQALERAIGSDDFDTATLESHRAKFEDPFLGKRAYLQNLWNYADKYIKYGDAEKDKKQLFDTIAAIDKTFFEAERLLNSRKGLRPSAPEASGALREIAAPSAYLADIMNRQRAAEYSEPKKKPGIWGRVRSLFGRGKS